MMQERIMIIDARPPRALPMILEGEDVVGMLVLERGLALGMKGEGMPKTG